MAPAYFVCVCVCVCVDFVGLVFQFQRHQILVICCVIISMLHWTKTSTSLTCTGGTQSGLLEKTLSAIMNTYYTIGFRAGM